MTTIVRALGALAALTFAAAAFAQEPLRIGFLTVRTGPLAAGGRQMEEGINLFLKERNNMLAGRRVEIIFADTAGQPAQAKTKAQELVEREKVHILVGPLATFEALAIDEYVLQAKVPLLPPMSAAQNDLAQRKQSDYVIHTYGTAAQAMYALGDYAATKLGMKRMAMIADDFTYGHEGAAGFQKTYEDAGGRIVQKLWPPLNAPDYGSFIGQLKNNVDGVYAGFAGSNPLRFLRAYREYGLKATVFGNPTLTDEGILKNMGDEALGVYTASWYAVDHDTLDNRRFVSSIRKEYKVTPGFYTAATYTSGLWIEEAMKLVKGKFEDKAAFVRALHDVKLDHGPMGPLRLDEYGKPILNVYVRKVERRNGELVNITVATGQPVLEIRSEGIHCRAAVQPRVSAAQVRRALIVTAVIIERRSRGSEWANNYGRCPELGSLGMTPLSVNGKPVSVDAEPDTPLLWVLRDFLDMTGTKFGCGMALCGACTVHVDGRPTRSCVTPLSAVTGRRITTIEGIEKFKTGRAVQAAWVAENVPQCGYCQSGQIMSATALLSGNKDPSDAQIDAAMAGNICRCATYPRIRAAIKRAAKGLA